jgi:uncharacterized protein (TIGR03118 family)
MQKFVRRILTIAACCGFVLALSGASFGQYYTHTNLVSNLNGAAHKDVLLKNPWGLAYGPGAPFWISDEASGWSTLYDGKGNPQTLQVTIPPAMGAGKGTPTGIVFNGSTEFQIDTWPSAFLFATLDGTISGWSHFEPSNALIGVTHAGAVYTGLAITAKTSGNTLYAADFKNNKVDMYDGSFNLVKSFTDPAVPAGFATFGVQLLGGKVYVSFASTSGGTGGYIDVFGPGGALLKRLVHGVPLNQPWGMAMAPSTFGPLSGTLLVSNNTPTGLIHGFDPTTGKLVGTITDINGKGIAINGLWGIEFGGGTANNGFKNQLFYTAGPGDTNGLFGVINFHK